LCIYYEIVVLTEVQFKKQKNTKNLCFTETAQYVKCAVIFDNIMQWKETSLHLPGVLIP